MPTSQWTTEIIVICTVLVFASALLGYFVSALRQGRRLSQLTARLEQAQQQQEITVSQHAALQASLKAAETNNQNLQVAEGRLQEQLAAAHTTTQQLTQALDDYKAQHAALQGRVDEANQQRQAAETQREADQGHISALKEKTEELKTRLAQSENALQSERDTVNALKEALVTAEGKRAEAEAADRKGCEQLQELKAQLGATVEKYDALQERLTEKTNEYTQLKTALDEREASHAREVAHFEQQKISLSEQFKLLSNEILEAKTRSLQESSTATLSTAMNPFQQYLETFKREVQDIHHREAIQQGELLKELKSLKELNQQITTEAHELSTALRGQKKLQGNWGELLLENVLERSGLQLDKDYAREVSINTEEDGRRRPDAIVYLPQGKHLIIDAKVSLNAYTRFVNCESESERASALKQHVQAVASRIKELADRNYYQLPGLNSPDIVFMFIPIESAFVEALKADETLFQKAIENNVLVATPTTLLTSLNIVRQLWRYENQNKHTALLAKKAEAAFKKLDSFLGSFAKIKKGLENASAAYITAESQLVSGKGNLVKQMGEFKSLVPTINAQLPSYFTEKADLEINFIPPNTSEPEPTEALSKTV